MRSVKGPLELARIAPAPILNSIPYIETKWEQVGQRRRTWTIGCLVALLTIVSLLGVNFFLKPLSALLDSLMRSIALL